MARTTAEISEKRGWFIFSKSLLFSVILLLPIFAQAQETKVLKAELLSAGFVDISSVFITPTPNIFITERANNRFLKLNLDGFRLDSLGRTGSGSYQFDGPMDIDATNELKIFVSDYNNQRIQMYDRRFQYLSSIRLPRIGNMRAYRPTYLTVNNLGEVFFYDELDEFIYKFNYNGSYEQRFSTRGDDEILKPVGMVSIDDAVFIADAELKVVHFISSNGRYLGFIAGFEELNAIDAWNEKLFIADGSNIVVYNMFGRNLGTYKIEGISKIRSFAVFRNQIILTDGSALYKVIRTPFESLVD